MASRVCSSVLLACALGAGGGCDATVDPLVLSPKCPTHPIRDPVEAAKSAPAEHMISDFDSDTTSASPPAALLNQVAGRDGSWVVGAATTTLQYFADRSDDCSARGRYAGHFYLRNWASWGVNWTAAFHPTTASGTSVALPYDGRDYGGISLWAAYDPVYGTEMEVRVGISTMDTAWNGGICVAPNCSDHYLDTIKVKSSWEQFFVPFSRMKQMGYGDPPVPTMRKDQMVGFIIWPTQVFDLWVDDIRFELPTP